MPAEVIVVHKWARITDQDAKGVVVVDTTARDGWRSDLSPFSIGPCRLYDDFESINMENAWQYAKVYQEDTDKDENPTSTYWSWAKDGWNNPNPVRYPKGRNRIPLYSMWNGKKLCYIEARKQIYVPLYAEAVQRTDGFTHLKSLYDQHEKLYLRDWDGWSMQKYGMNTLTDVLNNPRRKMGHAFVLSMLLTEDKALSYCAIREPA